MNAHVTLRPQRAALRNGPLVRYTLSVLLNVIAEWAVFLGVLVHAFDSGGATATGLASIALLAPYVVCAPLAAAYAERYPPQRVRIAAMTLQTAAWSVAALAAAADLAPGFVATAAMIGIAGTTALGPAGAVLRPALVRSSAELTVANLWTGYADSVSVLGGPLLATALLLVGGAPAVLIGCSVVSLSGLAVSVVRRPADPPASTSHTARQRPLALIGREIRDLRGRPGVLGVMTIAGGQFFAVGALDIALVVAAERDLGLGPSGPGALAAAFGAGALVSGAISTFIVRRRRLAPVIGVAVAALTVASVTLGVALSVVAAFVLLPLIGAARSLLDLLGQMLLQRSAPPEALASVFAVLELASGVGLILGSLSAQLLIAVAGVPAAFIGLGVFFALMLAGTIRSLRVADDAADVPVVAMSLLRHVPMFVPLPRPALESVARSAIEVPVGPGDIVITQGDPGDRFYAVADGTFEVTRDGRTLLSVGRGGSFGEVALLADVPRTASVRSTHGGSLLAIDRSPFLVAVTGHDSCRQAAWGVLQRLEADGELGLDPNEFARPPVDDDGT